MKFIYKIYNEFDDYNDIRYAFDLKIISIFKYQRQGILYNIDKFIYDPYNYKDIDDYIIHFILIDNQKILMTNYEYEILLNFNDFIFKFIDFDLPNTYMILEYLNTDIYDLLMSICYLPYSSQLITDMNYDSSIVQPTLQSWIMYLNTKRKRTNEIFNTFNTFFER